MECLKVLKYVIGSKYEEQSSAWTLKGIITNQMDSLLYQYILVGQDS